MNSKVKKLILVIFFLSTGIIASLFFIKENVISISDTSNVNKNIISNTGDKTKNIKIFFVGDMMFDRYIRQTSEKYGYLFLFKEVETLFESSDLVIGNLEGPITDNDSVSLNTIMGEKNNYVFTFDPEVVSVLVNNNIKLVNIGNNHIANFGSSGIESTRNYLKQSKVSFFGDPERDNNRIALENIKGLKISFVNYNQFIPNGEQKTFNDISRSKNLKSDFIVVYTHWGTEFKDSPSEYNKELAHKFIDAGADLVVGSHPHVVQPKEEYKGKMIYYSIGNFIFDQYFDPNAQKGLAIEVEVNPNTKKSTVKEYPIRLKKSGQTILAEY